MAPLFYILNIILLQSGSDTQSPPPPGPGDGTEAPGLPIDDNIWILLIVGVFFGIYIIYKRNLAINKAA